MTSRWTGPLLVAGMVAFSLAVWPSLPERVATHWNVAGEVDGWMGRTAAALAMPALALPLWAMMLLLPRIDPERRSLEKLGGDYLFLVHLVLLFLGAIHVAMLGHALGWNVDVPAFVLVAVGLLFVGIGNYLPRVRPNWTVGIRTPWTLSSEKVWRRTHRLAGRTMVAGGLLAAAAAFLPEPARAVASLSALLGGALAPAAYSYFAWKRDTTGGRP